MFQEPWTLQINWTFKCVYSRSITFESWQILSLSLYQLYWEYLISGLTNLHALRTSLFSWADVIIKWNGVWLLLQQNTPLDLIETGKSLKVQAERPHLVSLGSGRLSTAITLLPLLEGKDCSKMSFVSRKYSRILEVIWMCVGGCRSFHKIIINKK